MEKRYIDGNYIALFAMVLTILILVMIISAIALHKERSGHKDFCESINKTYDYYNDLCDGQYIIKHPDGFILKPNLSIENYGLRFK